MSLPNIIESVLYRDSSTPADLGKILSICNACKKSESQARLVVSYITECFENSSKINPNHVYNSLSLLDVLVKNVPRMTHYASSEVMCALVEKVSQFQKRVDVAKKASKKKAGKSGLFYGSLSSEDPEDPDVSKSPDKKAMKLIALWGTLYPAEFPAYAAALDKWQKVGVVFPPILENDIFPLPKDSPSSTSKSQSPSPSPQPKYSDILLGNVPDSAHPESPLPSPSSSSSSSSSSSASSSKPPAGKSKASPQSKKVGGLQRRMESEYSTLAKKMELQSVSRGFIAAEKLTKTVCGYVDVIVDMCSSFNSGTEKTIDFDVVDGLDARCCECVPKLDSFIKAIMACKDPGIKDMTCYEKETALKYLFDAKDKIEAAELLIEKTKKDLREVGAPVPKPVMSVNSGPQPPPYASDDDDDDDENDDVNGNPWEVHHPQQASANQDGSYLEKLLESN